MASHLSCAGTFHRGSIWYWFAGMGLVGIGLLEWALFCQGSFSWFELAEFSI